MDETPAAQALTMDAVQQLSERLNAKHAQGECPVCRTNDWSLPVDATGSITEFELVPVKAQQSGSLSIPVYTFICRNCGFVRMHTKTAWEGRL